VKTLIDSNIYARSGYHGVFIFRSIFGHWFSTTCW